MTTKQFHDLADKVFPNSKVVAAASYSNPAKVKKFSDDLRRACQPSQDFKSWFVALKKRISEQMWPGGPVTCLGCDGHGCSSCNNTGRKSLGSEPSEISKVELALRILLNAMPHCPPQQLTFAEQAIDLICKRWSKLRSEMNTPPF